jgi:hypothetical protein
MNGTGSVVSCWDGKRKLFAAMLFAAELLVLIPVAHVRDEFHWATCPG